MFFTVDLYFYIVRLKIELNLDVGKSIQVIPWQGLNDNSLWGPWVLFVIVVNFAL